MGYNKLIIASSLIELYEYDENIRHSGRGPAQIPRDLSDENLRSSRTDIIGEGKQKSTRRRDNAQRAGMAFRRLISSNLEKPDNPLLITLTYAKSEVEVRQSRSDFNAFARGMRTRFGNETRYIAVSEFQKRGTIHYHALFWGLPTQEIVKRERHTRLVAGIWGHGFIDLVATDGSHKIAGYLAKYMQKTFLDARLAGLKAYICSRNIKRPTILKNVLISPLFYGDIPNLPDLSTAEVLQDKNYMTKWLGKGRYRLFDTKI